MGAPTFVELQRIAMKANGTVTANRLVKLNTTEGEVLHTAAITDRAFGVAIETVATTLMTTVEVGNGAIVKLVASGAVTAGDPLMPAAAGGGLVSTQSGATSLYVGEAITGAASGETFIAKFNPSGKTPVSA